MNYTKNPKMVGSGMLGAIPQTGRCPNNCEDCFFQSGRSYLEPLDKNLPNLPTVTMTEGRVVRMNDGNDSNVERNVVEFAGRQYQFAFFNTAIPERIGDFPGPVVLTVNPGTMTDSTAHFLPKPLPNNLMFVRFRTNTWNLALCDKVVKYYTTEDVAVVLTFMAYFRGSLPDMHILNYTFRKRTLNSYWAITTAAWRKTMQHYQNNNRVYSCGHIEGEKGSTKCRHCGNCLREFFAARERMYS